MLVRALRTPAGVAAGRVADGHAHWTSGQEASAVYLLHAMNLLFSHAFTAYAQTTIYELFPLKILTPAFESLTRLPYRERNFGDSMTLSIDFALDMTNVRHITTFDVIDLQT